MNKCGCECRLAVIATQTKKAEPSVEINVEVSFKNVRMK